MSFSWIRAQVLPFTIALGGSAIAGKAPADPKLGHFAGHMQAQSAGAGQGTTVAIHLPFAKPASEPEIGPDE